MPNSKSLQPRPRLKTGVYEHYKGKHYLVLMTATLESTDELYVVYVPLYDTAEKPSIWLRSIDDFTASVDVGGVIRPRFRFIKA